MWPTSSRCRAGCPSTAHPSGNLHNLTSTQLLVAVALVIGTVELLGLPAEELEVHGFFCHARYEGTKAP